jgi:hypothetical protein
MKDPDAFAQIMVLLLAALFWFLAVGAPLWIVLHFVRKFW